MVGIDSVRHCLLKTIPGTHRVPDHVRNNRGLRRQDDFVRMGLKIRCRDYGTKPVARIDIDAAARGLVHEIPATGPYLDVGMFRQIDSKLEASVSRVARCQYMAVWTHDFQRRIVHGPFECLARDRHRVRG
ncbi:MAG: hypothetical protein GWP60_14370 [Gammaproteobacteria bacterium]|nr:hypothetical protein [Gammaproteobacteria bacterium]